MVGREGRRFKVGPRITVQLHNDEFQKIRHDPAIRALFSTNGALWVKDLNNELHDAQRARKQEVADGYTYHISTHGSRIRMYLLTFTARAFAHERKHSSILKLMKTSGWETVKRADLTEAQRMVAAQAKAASVAGARAAAQDRAERKKRMRGDA